MNTTTDTDEMHDFVERMTGMKLQPFQKIVQKKIWEIYKRREEILEAFIAETGCKPSECEMVITRTPTGYQWYVRRRK
jgi:hypothetical protein